MLYVITKSPFGDALRGIRDNRRRAEFAGLWVKRYELTAFVIAGDVRRDRRRALRDRRDADQLRHVDWTLSARALIVVLIGGMRYFLGPFAGAFFYLYVFNEVIQRTELWDTVLGVVVLVVALGLQGGLGGLIHWVVALGVATRNRLAGRRVEPSRLRPLPAAVQEAVHLPDRAGRRRTVHAAGRMGGPGRSSSTSRT